MKLPNQLQGEQGSVCCATQGKWFGFFTFPVRMVWFGFFFGALEVKLQSF